MHSDAIAALAQRLPDWYRQAGRDLPWRKTSDPYAIWVSEIMLQQTRVEAVRGYYHRFLEALPTVQALAEAPDDRLRKLWEGLGYYTRVMNMKKAANVMVTRYGGRFPPNLSGSAGPARRGGIHRRGGMLHCLRPAHPGGGRQRAAE